MKTSPSEPGIDHLLRTYFRSETPTRWPAAPTCEITTAAARNQAWTLASSRCLVGGSLVALLVVYLGLASFFPRDHAAGLNLNGATTIGERQKIGEKKATPPVIDSHP